MSHTLPHSHTHTHTHTHSHTQCAICGSRIHGVGMRRPDSAHPDNRAILYEEVTYSKRKINGFLSALDGFQTASRLPSLFSSLSCSPDRALLRRVVTLREEGGIFPDLSEQLEFFSSSFDHAKARREGTIIPARGVCVCVFVCVRVCV